MTGWLARFCILFWFDWIDMKFVWGPDQVYLQFFINCLNCLNKFKLFKITLRRKDPLDLWILDHLPSGGFLLFTVYRGLPQFVVKLPQMLQSAVKSVNCWFRWELPAHGQGIHRKNANSAGNYRLMDKESIVGVVILPGITSSWTRNLYPRSVFSS
jgi:hypothetical protein